MRSTECSLVHQFLVWFRVPDDTGNLCQFLDASKFIESYRVIRQQFGAANGPTSLPYQLTYQAAVYQLHIMTEAISQVSIRQETH